MRRHSLTRADAQTMRAGNEKNDVAA